MNYEFVSMMVAIVAMFITMVGGFFAFGIQFGGLKKTVEHLVDDVKELGTRIGAVEVRLGGLEIRLGRVEVRLDGLEGRLGRVEGEMSGMNARLAMVESRYLFAGNSPIRLTPVGQKIFDDVNGSAFVDSHYDELKAVVRDFGMDTKYDVQHNSIIAIEKVVDPDTLTTYKTYAYKEGKRLEQIFEAVGVYLRDRILEEQDSQ